MGTTVLESVGQVPNGHAPNVVVSLDPPEQDWGPWLPWLWLQASSDPLLTRFSHPYAETVTAIGVWSNWWGKMLNSTRSVTVGCPMMDIVPSLRVRSCRRQYLGFNTKPVALHLPYPSRSASYTKKERGLNIMRQWRLLAQFRRWCGRQGLEPVIKVRAKDGVPFGASRWATVIQETATEPVTLKLLSFSRVLVHTYSSAAFEAAAMGVRGLCITFPPEALGMDRSGAAFWHHDRVGGFYQYTGVTDALPMGQWPNWLPQMNPVAQDKYCDQYLGPLDGGSAKRTVDLIERIAR